MSKSGTYVDCDTSRGESYWGRLQIAVCRFINKLESNEKLLFYGVSDVSKMKEAHPNALVLIHPEAPLEVALKAVFYEDVHIL